VYFHGNGGNISTRLDGYRDIHFRLGANVLAIDYRGFGQSTGVLSEAGTYADARAAIMAALLRRNAGGPGPLVLLGVSMGAAIASRMAMEFEPDAIVLESAPPSFPELAPLHRPWTRYMPVRRLMQTRYETCAYLASVDVPALFVHGDMDEVVPLEFGRKTFRAANNPKHMWVVPGGTHDRPDKIDRDTYYGLVCEFLQRHTHSVAVPRTLRAAI
jgi:hypothetical protein